MHYVFQDGKTKSSLDFSCIERPLKASFHPDGDQDGSDEGFFYDEAAALEGAGADGRAQMLDHLDSLLQMPRADELDSVSLTGS